MRVERFEKLPQEAVLIREEVFMKEQGFEDEFDEVDKEAEQEIYNQGGEVVRLSAQVRASEFYKKQGYVLEGEQYLDEGCPHIWMRKK